MALILCLDTATHSCSVALSLDGRPVAEQNVIEDEYVHAERLHLLIQEVMKAAGHSFADIHAIGVGKGPGSYTGLRIGVSTAKGLAYALNVPLISVPTLQTITANASSFITGEGTLRPLMDARRMEVYSQAFGHDFSPKDDCRPHIIDADSFSAELIAGPVYFFGDGMDKCREVLAEHANARFIDNVHPLARGMCAIAEEKLHLGETEDVAYFEPFYLKDFVAKKSKPMV